MLQQQWLGGVVAVDAEEGGRYDWELQSRYLLDRNLAGGGVLVDTGSHLIDRLLWWLEGADIQLDEYLDDATIAAAQKKFAHMDSVGQQRMAALHGGRKDQLEVSPNLWAGIGLVRGGAGTALVGDPETVAARIQEYADLGIDTFIFSGYPHLEESIRFAELVFPLLPLKTRKKLAQPHLTGPFGEIIANNYVPETTEAKNLVKETA